MAPGLAQLTNPSVYFGDDSDAEEAWWKASAGKAAGAKAGWACGSCTLVNVAGALCCAVCGTRRRRQCRPPVRAQRAVVKREMLPEEEEEKREKMDEQMQEKNVSSEEEEEGSTEEMARVKNENTQSAEPGVMEGSEEAMPMDDEECDEEHSDEAEAMPIGEEECNAEDSDEDDSEVSEEDSEEDNEEAAAARAQIKVEAGLEFLPRQYHGVLRRLPPAPVTESGEYQKLYAYFLEAKEVVVAKAGGGSRSGQVRQVATGEHKCFLEKHARRYGSLLEPSRRLEREGKHAALLVLLRLAMRTIVDPPEAGERLPCVRPRLVNPDLTGERVDLAGGGAAEEEEKEGGSEGAGSAAHAEMESLAGSVEAYCDAAGADAVAPVEEPRVKIEPRSDDE